MRKTAIVLGALLTAAPASAFTMRLASTDFADGSSIPTESIYPRCGGENSSPELHWSDAPAGTKSFVLTMIDEDVKPAKWSHWIVVDLPPTTARLGHRLTDLPSGAHAVVSNFGDPYYDGPCPPKGSGTHHYRFTIWAMREARTLIDSDAKPVEVEAQLRNNALDHASTMGWVKR